MFGKSVEMPTSSEEKPGYRMVIDWPTLREIVGSFVFNGNHPQVILNADMMNSSATSPRKTFHGYDQSQLKTWLTKGFETDLLEGLSVSPVREKRRYIYAEDAEEIFVDRVLSGEDAYMGGWTNQTIIPGISIEADVMFSAMVSSEIVNDYNIFICQCIQSLEESGIDCELTLNFQSNESLGGKYRGRHDLPVHNVVRVKRENEASDFGSFSPMISPAALRTFGFAAIMIHNEIRRVKAPAGLGRGHRGRSWDVKYDDTSGKILFQCEYSPRSFPISTMQTKFQNAIAEISG